MIDKQGILMYNHICTVIVVHKCIFGRDVVRMWRNTQEAEEAPLLRV